MATNYFSLPASDGHLKEQHSFASTTADLLPRDDGIRVDSTRRPPILRRTTSGVASVLRHIHESWTWYLTSHILCLLWIAPIVALLVLNFESYIIGASAWCPFGHCLQNAGSNLPEGVSSQKELDRRDHNLLGALQFVAKAIEVWFTFIATSLVFDVIMVLARSSQGIPLGYLFTHLEFSDLRSLGNPLLYTSAKPSGQASKPAKMMRFRMFIALAVFLTILTNLMGPSIAALLIPALQYVTIFTQTQQQFQAVSSSQPPSGDDVFIGTCASEDLSASQYGCTAFVYAPNLDSMASFVDSSFQDVIEPQGVDLPVIQEAGVSFVFNISQSDGILWAPNRQVLRDISVDYFALANSIIGSNMTFDYDIGNTIPMPSEQKSALNRSLSTSIERDGPSLGLSPVGICGSGNLLEITDITSSADQTVRCLNGYVALDDDYNTYLYTKCFRANQGWNETNTLYQFSLDPAAGNLSDGPFSAGRTYITTYFSDKAVYFNQSTDFGSGMSACYNDSIANQGKSAPSCDWDKIFSDEIEIPGFLQNSTRKLLNTEYFPDPATTMNSSLRVWCDTVSVQNFTTYSLDAGVRNYETMVNLGNFPIGVENSSPIVVDPSWLLAAWSVNPNSSVSANRTIVSHMQRTLQSWQGTDYTGLDNSQLADIPYNSTQNEFSLLHYLTILQALSMVNYDFTNITGLSSKDLKPTKEQPIFSSSISIQVWAYGLNSRTAILGAVVSILGILVVLSRLVLAFVFRNKSHFSELELLVAALEHRNQSDFESRPHEKDQARVRFQISKGVGDRPIFIPKKII